MDLASELRGMNRGVIGSPWEQHETVRGFAVMSLPFESGYVLASREIPQSDFGPYSTIWIRRPDGRWSLHVDGPMLEVACPRYWGPAAMESRFASINLDWTGPNQLQVTMDQPALEWTFNVSRGALLATMNAINTAVPLWTWRPRALMAIREWLADHLLNVGKVDLSGRLPSGMNAAMAPKRVYRIRNATARLDGVDLGAPARASEPPHFGDFKLPSSPLFAIGEAHVQIGDLPEYHRLIREVYERSDPDR